MLEVVSSYFVSTFHLRPQGGSKKLSHEMLGGHKDKVHKRKDFYNPSLRELRMALCFFHFSRDFDQFLAS